MKIRGLGSILIIILSIRNANAMYKLTWEGWNRRNDEESAGGRENAVSFAIRNLDVIENTGDGWISNRHAHLRLEIEGWRGRAGVRKWAELGSVFIILQASREALREPES
jgi:hypothetical protein